MAAHAVDESGFKTLLDKHLAPSPLARTLKLIDVVSYAKINNVHVKTILRRIEAGEMPRPLIIGAHKYFRQSDLLQWWEEKQPRHCRTKGAR